MWILDLETEYDDRGYFTRNLTIVSVLDATSGRVTQYDITNVYDLVDQLPDVDLVLGYNIQSFDLSVLSQYAPRPLVDVVNYFDMYRDLSIQAGRTDLQFDNIARGTLGYALPQHGGSLANYGELRQLKTNSANGVEEEFEVWKFGVANRFVTHEDPITLEHQDIPVTWTDAA